MSKIIYQFRINNDSDKPDGTTGPSDFDPNDSLMPSSDFHIRNRYLSRIGAVVSNRFNCQQHITHDCKFLYLKKLCLFLCCAV